MKLRHSELESFRANPRGFLKQASGEGVHYGQSMYLYWQYALRSYHRNGRDVDAAAAALEADLRRHFKINKRNERRIEEFVAQLIKYASSFEALGQEAIDVQKSLVMPISADVIVTGRLARLDLIPAGGYAVYVFQKGPGDWRSEIRFPLLQAHFAQEFHAPAREVRVGVYAIHDGAHDSTTFDANELADAKREMARLLKHVP